ncbi:MAG: RtcB family protein [Candidatus Pacearchaeota archaeon]
MESKKICDNIYEIPREGSMNVPGRVYASEEIFSAIQEDKTLTQARNVACLPGIISHSITLPDSHQGYGFPIGGVAAFDKEEGVISPGGVGYDINCSVRLLKTNLNKKDVLGNQNEIMNNLDEKIPSGVGRGSPFSLSKKQFNEVLEKGAEWLVEKGYGRNEDLLKTEEEGCIGGADVSKVSERAVKRGIGQLGTIGSGNHFVDVLFVDETFDKKTAETFGLSEDQVVILIHCGSRGLGHQIASDYMKAMEQEYGFDNLPDRELICAPIKSQLGKEYYGAMCCAVNFAFANKQLITHWIRSEMQKIFSGIKVGVVYDVSHNIAKFEKHLVNGEERTVCVHRKGATRSFGPGRDEIPEVYRHTGQPVLIPGSMGTPSYVMVGSEKSDELTFGSSVHGAGRVMSRSKAMKNIKGEDTKDTLQHDNIEVKSRSMKAISQESPQVYKNIEEVVSVVHDLDISKKVARLKPLIVIIG